MEQALALFESIESPHAEIARRWLAEHPEPRAAAARTARAGTCRAHARES